MNDNSTATIMPELLARRARAVLAHGGSAEQLLSRTRHEVLAVMPLDARVPDAVHGSLYVQIAEGIVPAGWARHQMDMRCVAHSDYAWRWLEHACAEERGHSPAQIADAEILELVDHPHWGGPDLPDLPALDVFDAVAAA
jgi:hypothetical protein